MCDSMKTTHRKSCKHMWNAPPPPSQRDFSRENHGDWKVTLYLIKKKKLYKYLVICCSYSFPTTAELIELLICTALVLYQVTTSPDSNSHNYIHSVHIDLNSTALFLQLFWIASVWISLLGLASSLCRSKGTQKGIILLWLEWLWKWLQVLASLPVDCFWFSRRCRRLWYVTSC